MREYLNLLHLSGPPPIFPAKDADVGEIEIKCEKCQKAHKFYVKFKPDKKIDTDMIKKGLTPFPDNNTLVCDCGHEIDLSAIKNYVETKVGKKIIIFCPYRLRFFRSPSAGSILVSRLRL